MTSNAADTTTNAEHTYTDVLRFHGHECPGAAVGLRMAEVAVARFGRNAKDNRVIAVSETDSCSVDAVQVVAGCTYGTRTLVHEDNGKNAFTFWRGSDGAAIRVKAKPGSDAYRSEEIWALAEKVEGGTATADEHRRFAELQSARIERILAAPVDDILLIEDVAGDAPAAKPLVPYDACADCGEQTSIATLHNHRGRIICPACHLAAHGGVMPPDHGHHHHDHHHPDFDPHRHGNGAGVGHAHRH